MRNILDSEVEKLSGIEKLPVPSTVFAATLNWYKEKAATIYIHKATSK